MFEEFKKFIMRGNVMDLAIGIILGSAFTSIVTSLVNDVLMPPIGLLLGGVDFSDIALVLQEAQGDIPAVTIGIGVFVNAIINFLIVAGVVFLLVRGLNRMVAKEEAKPEPDPEPTPTQEELMIEELRAIRKALESPSS